MAMIGIDISKKKPDCLWLKDVIAGKVKSRVFDNAPEKDIQREKNRLEKAEIAPEPSDRGGAA